MRTYMAELEARTITLADSKADAADCYLRFKQKVDYSDFQRLLEQVMEFKAISDTMCTELPERLETFRVGYAKDIGEIKSKFIRTAETVEELKAAKDSSEQSKNQCEIMQGLAGAGKAVAECVKRVEALEGAKADTLKLVSWYIAICR